ncbi:T9SS type A sorting domain-containing protein [Mucilaginibacter agri]|uniref:T9SS type A sorting domain-containing protein n=1 Tax=Mucilaginibacter agri TaxID=2695265 RepID=A0A965ZEW2_9SPHI|nr:T9SS type A sorting domain-containing protein [Mucilaginibacter agri]NCD68476.1 T9SS type A sorting domain-containing protein [Mucilaginibacter agri]
MSINFAFASAVRAQTDTAYLRIKNAKTANKSYLKGGFHLPFPSLKSLVSPSSKAGMAKPADDKLLSNVTIFPNPVTDQINLKYTITRNTNVTIKIMDVLGNNVLTLLSQRMDPGEQKFSYNLNKQLTSGFYFVRVMVGTESIIRRISVL